MINMTALLRPLLALLALLPLLALPAAPAAAQTLFDPAALRLADAQAMALERNPDLRIALAALVSARAAIASADTAPNPVLTLQTMGVSPSAGVGPGGLRSKAIDSAIRIDQQFERGGKRELRVRNAQFLEQAAREDLSDVRRQLKLAVAQAYYDLLAAQEKREVLRDTLTLYRQTMDAAERRRKAGDLAGADVARIQVDALRAANDVESAESVLLHAQETLALALGSVPDPRRLKAIDPWPDPAEIDEGAALDALVDARADVRAARARLRAAEEGVRLALSLRTRDVTVGVQAEHYPQNGANSYGTGNSFGIAVQIPLYLRNQYEGEIRNAEAQQDSARESLQKVRMAARSELAKSRDEARVAAAALRRYDEELLPAAKRSAEAAEYAFRNGAIGVMDVLDARRTRRATELEAAAARADHARALAAWRLAQESGEKE
jgi:cobalt-zinc-cadmium efflux system outer membrane protein